MKYGIFIIESLKNDDDKDGKILHEILDVCQIKNKYLEIVTKQELITALSDFKKSNYRYLHLSFHANEYGFELTDSTFITNSDFSEIISLDFKKRRIFMSSCKSGNINFAGELITKNKIYSIIGSPEPIRFDKSLLFYPTFYHLMNEYDEKKMLKRDLKKSIRAGSNLFKIPIHYYAFLRKNKIWNEEEVREYKFIPNNKLENNRIRVKTS
ncbi:hypothetical protein [Maribellus maritimus]|uniref:hypothetical protein n=1 Tax=Maribellus maritimus TaxID=2870838 RepID=UPI001EEBE267|nr:hypothetical protein [Maribellus maritimus]MCG6191462.1 hypothetical protein [Maribellus maritimus]